MSVKRVLTKSSVILTLQKDRTLDAGEAQRKKVSCCEMTWTCPLDDALHRPWLPPSAHHGVAAVRRVSEERAAFEVMWEV